MIDVESQIYTPIAEALRKAFPEINVSGEYVKAPSSFPHVSIVEQDNYPTLEHMSNGDREKFATLMYEMNVYSNKSTGKKTQCRRTQVYTAWWPGIGLKRTVPICIGGKVIWLFPLTRSF